MKPVAYDYHRAGSLADAAAVLRQADGTAKVLAGGQSLAPMLNLRLVQPRLLVDITGIAELTRVEEREGHLVLGACITHADLEDGRTGGRAGGALPRIASGIAYRAVRNRGTIGGSLCHADPAADWLTALTAFGAACGISNGGTTRWVAVEDLVLGAFETVLGADDIVAEVRIPILSTRGRWGYYKICRKAGEFADAIGAVVSDPERGVMRAVIGATDGRPILVTDAAGLVGEEGRLDDARLAETLDVAGIVDAVPRRRYATALARAAQRMEPAW